MPTLFDPIVIGDLALPNRILMAPLTRLRAGESRIPNAMMAEYYAQRASAGLIISEGVPVSPQGVGYAGVPGVWSKDQVEGWKQVTRAVHAAGGRIFMQIWHVGRISDPVFLGGELPVAPSAIAPAGRERIFLDRFYNELSANPKGIDEQTRRHYATLYARPHAMHDAFEQFVAFPKDGVDNQALLAKGKLTIPVLAIGGGASYGASLATELGFVATDVQSVVIQDSGHWLMEEQPAATTDAILAFLAARP